MTYFKKITNIVYEEEFKTLTTNEQKEYLLETLNNFLLEECTKKHITFTINVDLITIIRRLNASQTSKQEKEFNQKIIGSITYVMSKIQQKQINYEILNNRYLINPMYTYENNKLIYIRSYQKSNQIEVLTFLLNYLQNKFLLENEQNSILALKK